MTEPSRSTVRSSIIVGSIGPLSDMHCIFGTLHDPSGRSRRNEVVRTVGLDLITGANDTNLEHAACRAREPSE